MKTVREKRWNQRICKGTLKWYKYKDNDLKIKKERIETLIEQIRHIEKEEDLVKTYCDFRKMNKEYADIGNKKERNLADPGTVYSIAKDKIDASGQVSFYSLLACCGTREYAVKYSSKDILVSGDISTF